MHNIVDILSHLELRQSPKASPAEDSHEKADRFLIDEGLGLLTAYRAIQDEGVRHAIRKLVEALAKVSEVANKEIS